MSVTATFAGKSDNRFTTQHYCRLPKRHLFLNVSVLFTKSRIFAAKFQKKKMATAQATKNCITLKGSTDIVTEFFGYAINSILYQRGIYPPDQFERKQKYGLTMLVTADDNLKTYIRNILAQLNSMCLCGLLA
jgi:hypothetical protein